MQVAMLGPLEVRAGSGEVLEVGGTRLRTLLIMLALRPGQLVPASRLIDGLWPDHPPAGAPNALQALVSRLRRALPETVIESRPAGYRLALPPQDTDIVRFEQLAAQGRAQLQADPAAAAATLREALELWRGPALPEVAGTGFGEAVIARLDEEKPAATEHRVDADLLTGPAEPLLAELEELVVAHPLREPLAARLMRAQHAAGRRGAALEVYERIRKRLADQLGADPSAELSALHLELLTEEPAPAPYTNLPAGLTSFVGRDAELAQVAGLLSAHRLVTLTGPRRGRQDPAGRRGGPGRAARHARRGVAGRAGPGQRPGRGPVRRAGRAPGPAGPGQLRAPGGRGRPAGRPGAGRLPAGPHPGHQPRAARHHRRGAMDRRPAGPPTGSRRNA